jgi:DNA mismatch repair protein MutS
MAASAQHLSAAVPASGPQLSLGPGLELQGELFALEPAPATAAGPALTAAPGPAVDPDASLDEATLVAEALERPRHRRGIQAAAPDDGDGSEAAVQGTAPAVDHRGGATDDGATPASGAEDPDGAEGAGGAEDADAVEESDLPRWHHHSLVDPAGLPPVLRHYVQLKAAEPDRVLLYRLGDFYEVFFEDAILLSRLLELTLTGKEAGRAHGRVPMAGIPHHAAERYCSELLRRGHCVALCDQLETTPARGELLRRGITRVLTPGTVLEEGMLSARRNNWLCAVVLEGDRWGLAVADVSTGEFRVTQRRGSAGLHQELLQLEPAEAVRPHPHPEDPQGDPAPAWCPQDLRLSGLARTPFELPEAKARLRRHFRLATLDGLGLAEAPLALRAAGGLLAYLDATQALDPDPQSGTEGGVGERLTPPIPLEPPRLWHAGDQLVLDAQTRRNLELTRTQLGGGLHGSLLWAVDRTMTAMGSRCLRRWIEAPLVDAAAIGCRADGVEELVRQRPLRLALRRLLRPMGDLERLAGRAGAGSASARDLVALADGLERLPRLAGLLRQAGSAPLAALNRPWPDLEALAARLRHDLEEAPPLSLTEGGLIHDGVDPVLDALRNRLDDQQAWLAGQEALERQASGNPNLRLQYHRSFGYFLAVSRARAARVPDHWIRRQTLANEERFVTPELKSREGRILQLRTRACQREYELFCGLRELVGEQAGPIRAAARLVAELDALVSLADVAATGGWCRPVLCEGRDLVIQAGRHPVVEQLLAEESFTPNDLSLGIADGPDLLVLTGPNASGKSCYLRQTGLLQVLAQIGSWVPARSARLGIADRIFTRVGAVDDLASGQSTFMVEMAETANILHHATDRSLVLLDEIGRGTATFDGLAIAWAVAEHLADRERGGIGARTIFATHYHELNELAALLPRVANAQVLVEETGDDLVFLHRVVQGGASRSYGIEAARLAGVPASVVVRARQVLGRIEANSHVAVGLQGPGEATAPPTPSAGPASAGSGAPVATLPDPALPAATSAVSVTAAAAVVPAAQERRRRARRVA